MKDWVTASEDLRGYSRIGFRSVMKLDVGTGGTRLEPVKALTQSESNATSKLEGTSGNSIWFEAGSSQVETLWVHEGYSSTDTSAAPSAPKVAS